MSTESDLPPTEDPGASQSPSKKPDEDKTDAAPAVKKPADADANNVPKKPDQPDPDAPPDGKPKTNIGTGY